MHSTHLDQSDRQAGSVVPVDAASIQPAGTSALRTRRRLPILPAALTMVALLGGSTLFISGYSMGRQSAVEPGTPDNAGTVFRAFWDTYHTIRDRYAGGAVDREAMVQGAIRGMIDSLEDPYSAYLTSEQYLSSLQGIGGQFEGIGAEIATQAEDGSQGCATLGPTCRLVIVAPIGGSPAERAGLRPGDLVLATDGVTLDGLTVDAARQRMRGPRNTVVELQVQRGTDAPFPLRIVRDVIQERELESRELVDGRIGYLRLLGFSDRAAEELATAVRGHVSTGRTMLILDLRGNPGGYVTAARSIASQFIGSGPIFWEQDAKGNQTAVEAIPGGAAVDPGIRLVVLVDRGSASASEIVAAALQDAGRALLVGQTTFGKGSVQQWQELPGGGGAFRLTIARWLTPEKRWIHDLGVAPDVPVTPPAVGSPAGDPVLDRAIEVLVPSERSPRGGP
jgi:carboxyl-terminal processing protease